MVIGQIVGRNLESESLIK